MPQVTVQTAPNSEGETFRTNINNILGALFSASSGATAPTVTVPGQFWFDTSVPPGTLKQRNDADSAWLTIGGANLSALAALTLVQGDLFYATGPGAVARLPKGAAAQVLRMNAGATAPEWGNVGGLTRLEAQQPLSDVSAITFATDISAYSRIMVEFVGQLSDSGASVDLQIRTTAGTWRTLASSVSTNSTSQTILARFEGGNINNADGSNLRRGVGHSGRINATLDRSANTAVATSATGTLILGYSSHTETINEIRLLLSGTGTIEGSNADQRAVAILHGAP